MHVSFSRNKSPSWGRSWHEKEQHDQNMKKETYKKSAFINICVYAHNESATNRTRGGMVVIGVNFWMCMRVCVLCRVLKWSVIMRQNGIGEHVLSVCHVFTACLLLSFTNACSYNRVFFILFFGLNDNCQIAPV